MLTSHCTHRTHITNTWNSFTGRLRGGNTFENLRRPRPLLVVHSGNITTGLSALLLMSSSGRYCTSPWRVAGIVPVEASILSRDTSRNPSTSERGTADRAGVEMAAEPVPVRRPGVLVIGVDEREAEVRSTSWHTGRRKVGL